jgi:hypothetical protein
MVNDEEVVAAAAKEVVCTRHLLMVSLLDPPVMMLAPAEPVAAQRGGRQRGAIDVLEIDDVGRVAGGLVGIPRLTVERQRCLSGADTGTTVDRGFRTPIGDRVVACSGIDGVGAACTVDHVVAGTAGDGVCAG